eukprot:scaffold12037_cov159-Ochromonas_danica.AAC.1
MPRTCCLKAGVRAGKINQPAKEDKFEINSERDSTKYFDGRKSRSTLSKLSQNRCHGSKRWLTCSVYVSILTTQHSGSTEKEKRLTKHDPPYSRSYSRSCSRQHTTTYHYPHNRVVLVRRLTSLN